MQIWSKELAARWGGQGGVWAGTQAAVRTVVHASAIAAQQSSMGGLAGTIKRPLPRGCTHLVVMDVPAIGGHNACGGERRGV